MSRPLAIVKAIDHLVLTCKNVPITAEWYAKHLGMKIETFTSPSDQSSTPRTALKFGTYKFNLHQHGKEFEPKTSTALPDTADLCFIVEDNTELPRLIEGFRARGVQILEGGKIVKRTGALGKIQSIYVRDPDGSLIE
ncbi:related to Virulence protein STM3117 [Fusarium fujikuroi]|nr:related to Virulence protein STM3117 [Fusarium fujikuroi]